MIPAEEACLAVSEPSLLFCRWSEPTAPGSGSAQDPAFLKMLNESERGHFSPTGRTLEPYHTVSDRNVRGFSMARRA